jgi:hypothetical protein
MHRTAIALVRACWLIALTASAAAAQTTTIVYDSFTGTEGASLTEADQTWLALTSVGTAPIVVTTRSGERARGSIHDINITSLTLTEGNRDRRFDRTDVCRITTQPAQTRTRSDWVAGLAAAGGGLGLVLGVVSGAGIGQPVLYGSVVGAVIGLAWPKADARPVPPSVLFDASC